MPLCKSVSPEFEAVKHAWKSYICVFLCVWMVRGAAERMAAAALNPNSWSINQAAARVFASRPRKHAHTSAYTSALSPARRVCVCDENGKNDSVLSRECCRGRRRYWCERQRKKQPKVWLPNFLGPFLAARALSAQKKFFFQHKVISADDGGRFICALFPDAFA